MKHLKYSILAAILLIISVRCIDEKVLQIETDFTEIPDSTEVPDVYDAYIDSLNPRKYIYLTIDDVPVEGSAYIDSIIALEKVKANLFLIGSLVKGSRRFLKYHEAFMQNPYIEIYNHSYSHGNNRYKEFYRKPEAVLEDFEKNRTEMNISFKIARLPGRNLWIVGERKKNCRQTGTASAQLLAENGYRIFGWDLEWEYDPKDCTPAQSVYQLVEEIDEAISSPRTFTANHVVLLVHNQLFGKQTDGNDLQALIRQLKEKDYTFEYLTLYDSVRNVSE
ncbi:MAG: polysaccharide deacetylase family protein [Tannerella sp.]|jgi:peptidoglycan/xylan/chitin deacetylase (PgdA/CDA1 family)|nr:polysaccharide deacetylase family protein [Tannerella sp.]